MYYKDHFITGR